MEFGGNHVFYAIYKQVDGVKIYTNYDFVTDGMPLTDAELKSDEKVEFLNGLELLDK